MMSGKHHTPPPPFIVCVPWVGGLTPQGCDLAWSGVVWRDLAWSGVVCTVSAVLCSAVLCCALLCLECLLCRECLLCAVRPMQDLAECFKLTILDISRNRISAEAIPPALFAQVCITVAGRADESRRGQEGK